MLDFVPNQRDPLGVEITNWNTIQSYGSEWPERAFCLGVLTTQNDKGVLNGRKTAVDADSRVRIAT